MPVNEFGQTIGDPIDTSLGAYPEISRLEGNYCSVEKLNYQRDFADLFAFFGAGANLPDWTYLPIEGGMSQEEFSDLLKAWAQSADPYYLVVRDKVSDKVSQKVVGIFSLMRLNRQARSVEMGWVIYSPALQRSRLATEAQYLVMAYVFEKLGYRRYEWKCDHLNQRSRKAAQRLGFTLEGTWRQATIYKGRSRDTDWLSLLGEEWPANKQALEAWLSPDNFTADGQQIKSLREFRQAD